MSDIEEPLDLLLRQQFELESAEATNENVQQLLANRIAQLLAGDMESFMSMLYRLDVPEGKIRSALSLSNDEAPNMTLAKLIIERQYQRMVTKRTFKQEPLDDWIDF